MIGATIHNWTVKERIGSFYKCICKCGTSIIKHSSDMTPEKMSKQCRQCNGHTIHGLSQHPLYSTWKNILDKCISPKHKDYKDFGAKGIKVVERWQDVTNFINDMGVRPDGHALTRLDLAADFGPDNCIWDKFSNVLSHVKEYNQQFKTYKRSGKPTTQSAIQTSYFSEKQSPITATVEQPVIEEQPMEKISIPAIEQKSPETQLTSKSTMNSMDALHLLRQQYADEETKFHNKRKAVEELLKTWQDLESDLSKILKS